MSDEPPQPPAVEEIRERIDSGDLRSLLEGYDNVNSAGIGLAERDGKRTGDVQIVLFVDEKLPEDDLPPDQLIPDELEGVSTDVIEDDPPTPDIEGARGEQIRPISSGVSAGGGGNGTACPFVDANGNDVLLTNRHVACDEDEDCTGGDFFQPDSGQPDSEAVGTITELGQWDGDAEDNVDAAIVEVDDGVDIVGELFGGGPIGDFESATVGEWYLNNGSRTGYIGGECIAVDVVTSVGFDSGTVDFANCVRFDRYDTDGSEWGGNSGSLHGRLDSFGTFHPVALHFAGSDSHSTAVDLTRVEEEVGTLNAPDAGDQSTFTGPELHEVGVTELAPASGDIELAMFVANAAGSDDPDDTLTVSAGGSTITSTGVSLESMEWSRHSITLPDDYNDGELTVSTSDDSQTVDVDLDLDTQEVVVSDAESIMLNDGGGEVAVESIYRNGPDDSEEVLVYSTDSRFGSQIERPGDNELNTGQSDWNGAAIEPHTEIAGFELRVSENTSELSRVGIQTHQQGGTDFIHLEDVGSVTAGDVVEVEIPDPADYLQPGEQYDVLMDNGEGVEYERGAYDDSNQYPYESADFDVFSGMFSDGSATDTRWYNYDRIVAITDPE